MARESSSTTAISPTKLDIQKQDYVRNLRKLFCVRKEFPETAVMIDEEGEINRAYFSVKLVKNEKPWTETETQLLLQGIEKFGVGHFARIREELLKDWTEKFITVKTMILLGTRDLSRYRGWKGTAKLVASEYEKNKAKAEAEDLWIHGVYDTTQKGKRKAEDQDQGKKRK